MFRSVVIWTAVFVPCLTSALVQAQSAANAEKGTVSGVGVVSVKRRPEVLRVNVEVFAAGKSIKAAIANLKDRREAIRRQLATLGAVGESIKFDEPEINTTLLEGRQRMETMIRSRMGKAAKADAKKAAATPSIISATLTAEWSLKGADTETLLVEVSQLKETITAADLAGIKDLDKLGSEDDELKEEMEGIEPGDNQNSQGQPPAGAPSFLLVSKVTAPDQANALAEAFRKAKEKAAGTAKAAGAGLGELRLLESRMQSGTEENSEESAAAAYYRSVQSGRAESPPEPDGPSEARGTQPGAVSFRVTVTAAFVLKEGR